eukprot:EG_transcript_15174
MAGIAWRAFALWMLPLLQLDARVLTMQYCENNASQFVAGPEDTVLVVSPHLDDAMFCMGGYLYRSQAQKWVVNVFAGAPAKRVATWWDKYLGFQNSDETLAARWMEDKRAWLNWNVTIINFDFVDQIYKPDEHLQRGGIRQQLAKVIAALKAQNRPLTVFGPAAQMNASSHGDHIKVHNALRAVAKEEGVQLLFYTDFPYVKDFMRRHSCRPSQYLARLYRRPVREAVLRLLPEDIEAKLARSREYRSQVNAVPNFLWDQEAFDLLCGGTPCETFLQLMPRMPAELPHP